MYKIEFYDIIVDKEVDGIILRSHSVHRKTEKYPFRWMAKWRCRHFKKYDSYSIDWLWF